MKHFFQLFLLLFFCQYANAQILNIEKNRVKGDSSNYFVGNLGITFSANNQSVDEQGNAVSFVGISANSNTGYISTHHSFLLIGSFIYNASTDNTINSAGFGHFRINFMRKKKLSYETFTQLQYDQGRGMQNRWIIGGGIRYRVYNNKKSSLYFGIGAMHEEENWQYPGNETRTANISIIKSTNYVSYKSQLSESIWFNLISYYQTGYDTNYDYFRHRLSADMGLIIKVFKRLSLNTNFSGTYENRPIVPINKFVYSVTNGFLLSF